MNTRDRQTVSRKSVLFLPDWSGKNPYQRLLASGISRNGCDVSFDRLKPEPFMLWRLMAEHPQTKVFHIHWIHEFVSSVFWSTGRVRRLLKLWLICLDILLVRVRGVRVVWTIHNLVAHDSPDPAFEIRIRKSIAKYVSRVIVHSHSALHLVEHSYACSLRGKSAVIPHGNYIGVYPDSPHRLEELRNIFSINPGNMVILFFGAIRRYKGVLSLVRSFSAVCSDSLRLVIAGECDESELESEIRRAAEIDPRIMLHIEYVPDTDVAPLFELSDAVVLPFERTLTSGSVVLAMSLQKALVLPEAARVFDLADEEGARYFSDEGELTQIIQGLDKERVRQMGIHNHTVIEAHNWDVVGRMTADQYLR